MTKRPAASAEPWSVGRLLDWTRGHFTERGLDEPRLAAELLLGHALGCAKIQLYTRFDACPTDDERGVFRELVKAAAGGEPIAYLIGRKEFYSLEFEVGPDVLIPRPETEAVVERALVRIGGLDNKPIHVLDVGTGSGCIAISIASRAPETCVLATDISEAALGLAARNAERHGVADRVGFAACDGLDLPSEARPGEGFDIIVSNPPYVAEDAPEALDPAVAEFEPHQALFGGPDGLDFYRRFARDACGVLKSNGLLVVEIGAGQADAVESLIAEAGMPALGRYPDLAGIDRVLEFGSTE